MSDEPEQFGDSGRPKFLTNVTAWVGGLTALVVALAGLRAAFTEVAPRTKSAAVQENASAENNGTANTAEAEAPEDPATVYTGEGVKMEWIDRQWVVNDKDGVTKYDQQGDRNDGMTYARTTDGTYALRWKNEGGSVELSDDADHTNWRHYYTVKPASADPS